MAMATGIQFWNVAPNNVNRPVSQVLNLGYSINQAFNRVQMST